MYLSLQPALSGFDGGCLRPATPPQKSSTEVFKERWECGKQGLLEILEAHHALEVLPRIKPDPLVAQYHLLAMIVPQIEDGLTKIANASRALRYAPTTEDSLRKHYSMELPLDGLPFVASYSVEEASDVLGIPAFDQPVEETLMLHGLYVADSTKNVLNVLGDKWADSARNAVIQALAEKSALAT